MPSSQKKCTEENLNDGRAQSPVVSPFEQRRFVSSERVKDGTVLNLAKNRTEDSIHRIIEREVKEA